ncbi:MAG: hypothetical protein WCY08_01835 [Rhodocyclaceae bacterium]
MTPAAHTARPLEWCATSPRAYRRGAARMAPMIAGLRSGALSAEDFARQALLLFPSANSEAMGMIGELAETLAREIAGRDGE